MENKRRLNFMDVLIILLILAVIAVGVYFLAGRGTGSSTANPGITVEYKVQFLERDKAVADMFEAAQKKGEKVWVGAKERTEADFTDIKIEPAREKTTNMEDGEFIMAEIPGYYDVTVTLKSSATETNDEILLNGTAVHVGDEVVVNGKGFAGYGYVIGLEIVK